MAEIHPLWFVLALGELVYGVQLIRLFSKGKKRHTSLPHRGRAGKYIKRSKG